MQSLILASLVLFVGVFIPILILVWANRRMMNQYHTFAGEFGLDVYAKRSFGLDKFPGAKGIWRGRTMSLSSAIRSDMSGRPICSMIHLSGNPSSFLQLTPGKLFGKTLLERYSVEGDASLLEGLSPEDAQALVDLGADEIVFKDGGVFVVIKQQLMSSLKLRVRYTKAIQVLARLLERAE